MFEYDLVGEIEQNYNYKNEELYYLDTIIHEYKNLKYYRGELRNIILEYDLDFTNIKNICMVFTNDAESRDLFRNLLNQEGKTVLPKAFQLYFEGEDIGKIEKILLK